MLAKAKSAKKPRKIPDALKAANAARAKRRRRERAAEKLELAKRDISSEHKGTGHKKRKGMSHAESAAHFFEEHQAEIEAKRAERAERAAARTFREHNTPKAKKRILRRNGQTVAEVTIFRPITPASRHYDPIPF